MIHDDTTTGWTHAIAAALAAPFPTEEIEFLPRAPSGGRALALPYIDARTVMRRLDAVVGAGGWAFDFDLLSPDGRMVRGRLTVLGSTRCDAGQSSSEDETLKSAVSDALKRCAVHFGIGRYIHDLPKIWAPYDEQKRRFTETPRLPMQRGESMEQGEAPPTLAPTTQPAALFCHSPACGVILTTSQNTYSIRAFGRPLCTACQKHAARKEHSNGSA